MQLHRPSSAEPPRKRMKRMSEHKMLVLDKLDDKTIKFQWNITNFADQPNRIETDKVCVGQVLWSVIMRKTIDGLSFHIALDDMEDTTSAHCAIQVINHAHRSCSRASNSFYHTYDPGEVRGYDVLVLPTDLATGVLQDNTLTANIIIYTHSVLNYTQFKFFKYYRDDDITIVKQSGNTTTMRWEIRHFSTLLL